MRLICSSKQESQLFLQVGSISAPSCFELSGSLSEEIPAHRLLSTRPPRKHNMQSSFLTTIGHHLPDSSMKEELDECMNYLIC